jgi:hypothetical protein
MKSSPCFIAIFFALAACGPLAVAAGQERSRPAWEGTAVVNCDGLKVSLARPRLVARSRGFLWFPTLHRFSKQHLVAVMSDYADEARDAPTALVAQSHDGGLTWSDVQAAAYSECAVVQPSGDTILLPYYLRFQSEEKLTGDYQLMPRGADKWQSPRHGVEVVGWPRKVGPLDTDLGGAKPEWKLGSFVFNGQTTIAKDGKTHLATLYGRFAGAKRYSLVVAKSVDGLQWSVESIIADDACKLDGAVGPCESALIRLQDGRLLCVYRLNSGVPYGHSFSDDDGKTWSQPQVMAGPHSVQPSLAISAAGVLALSGGRPGLAVWLNRKGDAQRWESIDLLAHHNAQIPDKPIRPNQTNTSSYTDVRWLDDRHFLVIYDRIPNGWKAIPADSKETNSVWVVRGRIE